MSAYKDADTPWRYDCAGRSRKTKPIEVLVSEEIREMKRKMRDLEELRSVKNQTKEVWD